MVRPLALALVLVALPALAKPPRLTLFITVDALGTDLLLRSRPKFKSGLRQLLDGGAFYPYARVQYAKARTAPGHATLITGANPWRHGIVDNRVVDRATGVPSSVFRDDTHPVLEVPLNVATEGDTSPLPLMAETLGDRLRISTRSRGKVVALSGKGRAAIALAGRLGQAYWFDETVGKFVTGTWYTKEFPSWLKGFNARGLADGYFSQQWTPLLPKADYLGEDERTYEVDAANMGRAFPHPLNGGASAPGPRSYTALAISPFSHDLLVQAAKAALEGEALGKDDVTDLLAVSFSGTDRVFHAYGPHSWEMQDTLYRLDRALGELLTAAERAAGGKANLVIVLSADHGGAAAPEHWASEGLPAQRLNPKELAQGLNQELKARFPQVEVTATVEELDVYLGGKGLTESKVDGATVRRAVADWLSRQPGITLAVARDDLYTAPDVGGLLAPLRRGYYAGRSGDVLYMPRPYLVVSSEPAGTNHSTPYSYDAQVPVVFAGKGVKPGTRMNEISTTDVAPTLGALMELGAPASAEGSPRPEVFANSR
ncbi:alkaline phosphatase family protein [Hyalangium rubrum]|uniref:Alkaline phosphatase family protein n=1 Tax=Hyalangium rubrum TaxID=3103134 RepID=A0ABU5HGK9_9BACT|nr:alkaline phosphatase family protein [Hyalangium sp. s54d21]MDY7232598.1 alkaline phosphatase family protein [Hyalangium sp. s54d21]